MTRELLLLGAGLALLLAGCGGEEKSEYSYDASRACFESVGPTRLVGEKDDAVRITTQRTKAFDILFLPSGQQAKNYVKKFKVPNGILETKGNVIVYGHQTARGEAEVTKDEMDRVEKCLA